MHERDSLQVAVIGAAVRLPVATTAEALWSLLAQAPRPGKQPAALAGIEAFDARRFGLSDAEAALLDPARRVLLECGWEALERAGLPPRGVTEGASLGVFVGTGVSDYAARHGAAASAGDAAAALRFQMAADPGAVASRLGAVLGAAGPCIAVDAADVTGPVALHLAARALRAGECDIALAGAACVGLPQPATAEGPQASVNGGAVVALRRLEDALAAGQPILAVLRGSAIGHDGSLLPTAAAQAAIAGRALASAGVAGGAIGSVTVAGPDGGDADRAALAPLIGTDAVVEAVSRHVGNLRTASGMLATVAAVLALHQRARPGRLAAVHVTAFGGACAHLVLAEAPPQATAVPAPPTTFDRHRLWLGPPADAPSAAPARLPHPVIGHRVPSPLPIEQFTAEAALDGLPWVRDHMVLGRPLVPAAAMVEGLLAAGAEVESGAPLELTDLHVQRALVLGAAPLPLHTALEPVEEGGWTARLRSRRADGSWLEHASGTLRPRSSQAPGTVDLDALRAAAPQTVPVADHYRRVAACGLVYGPVFQGLAGLWRGDGRALGYVSLPAGAEGADRHLLHPALLDAAFQVMFTAVADIGDKAFLPVAAAAVRIHRPGATEAWCAVTAYPAAPGARARAADLRLIAADGTLIAEVERLELVQAAADQIEGAGASVPVASVESIHPWLLAERWEPAPLPPAGALSGRWLVVGGEGALAARLTAQGAEARHVPLSQAAAAVTEGSWQGVVYLGGLADPGVPADGVAMAAAARAAWEPLLALVQALADAPPTAGLWLVTRGATAASGAPLVSGLPAATLWGMGRVIAQEHPEMACRRLDLDARAGEDDDALLALLAAPDDEDQMALRAGRRLVLRLTPGAPGAEAGDLVPPAGVAAWRLSIADRGQGIDGLALAPLERRPPGPGEVEIRVLAAGLNFRDVLNTLGLYPGDAGEPGAECAGVVEAVGPGVDGLRPGDRVMALAYHAHAQFITVDARAVARVPAALTLEQAAAVPAAHVTAWYGLHVLAGLKPGERVLIHAATGGVGQAAVALARLAGAEVFGTASPGKWDTLRAMGLEPLNSRDTSFAAEIDRLTGGAGVDVVVNCLTGALIDASLGVLVQGGRFIELGRTDLRAERLAAERPDVAYHVLDLPGPQGLAPMLDAVAPLLADGRLPAPRVTAFPMYRAREAFALMRDARHQGKIVLSLPRPARFRDDGAVLVTGGLGGLGLLVSRWMVERGARHVVLVGRRPPTEAARRTLDDLRAQGATVTVEQADAGDPAALGAVLKRLDDAGVPLRGVIHAAGALDDGALRFQTPERFAPVMAAKVSAAWTLHRLTEGRALDFFVLFSSFAGVAGLAGQANHAAANVFLDALARWRHVQGLPALSIDWGAWGEVGAAADQGLGESFARKGVRAMAPAGGLAALDWLMASALPHVGVSAMEWDVFLAGRRDHAFDAFRRATAEAAPAAAPTPVPTPAPTPGGRDLSALSPAARRDAVEDVLCGHVAALLGLPGAAAVDRTAGFFGLGFDSLSSVDLRNRLQAAFGISLPATVTFDHATVDALVDHVAGLLAPRGNQPEAAAQGRAVDALDSMTDDEAEAALLRELQDLAG